MRNFSFLELFLQSRILRFSSHLASIFKTIFSKPDLFPSFRSALHQPYPFIDRIPFNAFYSPIRSFTEEISFIRQKNYGSLKIFFAFSLKFPKTYHHKAEKIDKKSLIYYTLFRTSYNLQLALKIPTTFDLLCDLMSCMIDLASSKDRGSSTENTI